MPEPLVARLRAVGCVFAEEEAAEIRRVVGADEERADAVLASRANGIPLEHALGVAMFAGVEVEVGPGVFVPRTRAETLVPAWWSTSARAPAR
jgi:release factor glutamine methyltransferase